MNISVVIPAYNEEAYIEPCLRALARQTMPACEVILVDNNCSDSTVEIARRYHARVVKEDKQGIVFARNAGFDRARGDIIARIDADTRVPADWLERLRQIFDAQPYAAVSGPPKFYDVPFRRTVSRLYAGLIFDFNHLLSGKQILWGANMAIRRDAWQRVRALTTASNEVHEDLDLAFTLAKQNLPVRYQRRLVAGASLRRLQSSQESFRHYLNRWYRTLAHHQYRTYSLDRLIGRMLLLVRPPLASYFRSARR